MANSRRCSIRRVYECLGRVAQKVPSMERVMQNLPSMETLVHVVGAAVGFDVLAQHAMVQIAMLIHDHRRARRARDRRYQGYEPLVEFKRGDIADRFFPYHFLPEIKPAIPQTLFGSDDSAALFRHLSQEKLRDAIKAGVPGKQEEWDKQYGLVLRRTP